MQKFVEESKIEESFDKTSRRPCECQASKHKLVLILIVIIFFIYLFTFYKIFDR